MKLSKNFVDPFLVRSWLTFPAIKERFLRKIPTLKGVDKPDGVMFDLEDSIAETEESKTAARNQLLGYLLHDRQYQQQIFSDFVVAIRINHHLSSFVGKDIEAISKIKPHVVVIPKVEAVKQVLTYQKMFPHMHLCTIIETIPGYENRDAIIQVLRPYDMLGIGYEDLLSQLGVEKPPEIIQPHPLTHIINGCIISAKKHNALLVEGPSRNYGSTSKLKNLKKECIISLNMGFQSKVAIHPTQIRIINDTFNKDLLKKRAQRMLKKFDSLEDGSFVISNNKSEMMDKPSYTLYTKRLKHFHL